MILVITEKNDAAKQIARLLSDSASAKATKVYDTPTYSFTRDGEEWVCIGLRGHILAPDFPESLHFSNARGWYGVDESGEVMEADVPDGLARPPYSEGKKKPKRPFLADGVSLKGWKVQSLPYLVWSPIEKKPAEKGIIRSLKSLAKKADTIIIATDFDREGELIGADALSCVKEVNAQAPVKRARYSAYTKQEITQAFEHLVELDQDLADAGESRQYIDLIWGAVLTRYLTLARSSGFGNVRSAGRVQTPTLALVVERERERNAFTPEPYWQIQGIAKKDEVEFKLAYHEARIWDNAKATKVYSAVKDASTATVTNVTTKSRKVQPPAPFNTTSLQAAAAAEGLAPGRCMRLAESLYMAGLISYPRVDNTVYPSSLNLSQQVAMLKQVPEYHEVCERILSAGTIRPTRGKQQSTDHPPIYPTAPAKKEALDSAQWKLYNLVARRFLATLMDEAVIENTKVELDIEHESFVASGDVLRTPGFRAAYPYGLKKDEQLPALTTGDTVDIVNLDLLAKETEPPARYSQGKLIQEMEKRGLGTKSTRASIIDRLFAVKYLKNNPVEPSQLGIAIIDALDEYAPTITTPEMTSELDRSMDCVAEGKNTEVGVVDQSRTLLAATLDTLIAKIDNLGEEIADAVTADARVGTCPVCGKDLVIKNSPKTKSRFIGCMGWPDCDVTYPVPGKTSDKIEAAEQPCPVCGAPRLIVKPFRAKAYEVCVNPKCETNYEPDTVVGECSACKDAGRHGELVAHKSETTGKRFIRCTNFDICGVSYPLPQRGKLHATGKTCEACGAPMVEIETERGPWTFCVNMSCPDKKKRTPRPKKRRAKK